MLPEVNANQIDITLENFQHVILEESKTKVVMIQFWAPWSEPCTELAPVLQCIAAEYQRDLLFARVNCDEQQEIAGQFGVKGLPTVILVKDGQPLDGFAGPQEEKQIREMLDKHLPKEEDGLLQSAMELVLQGNYHDAFSFAKQALELNSERADIRLMMADCYVEVGQVELAKKLVEQVKLVDQDGQYQAIVGKIQLAEQAADSPEIQQLQTELEADPQSMELKVSLSVQLHQGHRTEEALMLLLSVLRQELGFGDAKKITLDMINALPDGDPLKSQYRRKIYSLLY
ncbi:MAG: putative thioredoxin [Bermanella sp.]|jgi:putative thioredoxin|uniref:thioredoxin family protein n=1 Tax=Glaciecola sp. 33A TaxID=2057807 RepID=UPI000C32AE8B|nr:co-chaperone YbbN [Glaciecola sp. 33A]PKI00717.1 co-chaperone YbbN [Glaciecola sp. 33A]